MVASNCPDRTTLYALLVGTLDEAELDTVVAHAGICPACQSLLERIDESADAVISRLRRCSSDLEDSPARREAALERLLVKAVALADALGDSPAGRADRTAIPSQLAEYRLLEKLGVGGMGAVYRAEHTKLRRIVAVKILPEDRTRNATAVARFEREMEALGRLNHPNIVQAFDAREIQGIHFLVMEYIQGLTLSELAARHGPLSIPDACELVRQASVGLQYAHEHGLVHRDIKPSNLMLAKSEEPIARSVEPDRYGCPAPNPPNPQPSALVKILDLGLALLQGLDAHSHGDLTLTGQITGTIDYMAPEQGDNSHAVDIRADLYSLGATMHKLLVGEPPLAASGHDSPLQKMTALATQDVPSLAERCPRAPAELVAVVDRMMARNPRERYVTPGEVAAALEPFCAGANLPRLLDATRDDTAKTSSAAEATDDAPFTPDAVPSRRSRRSAVVLVGAILFAVVVGGLLAGVVVLRIKDRQGEIVAEVTVADGHSVELVDRPEPNSQTGIPQSGSAAGALTQGKAAGLGPPLAIAPFDAATAKQHQQAWAEYLGLPVEYENSLGMRMRLLPPGEFEMGLSPDEIERLLKQGRSLNLHDWFLKQLPMAAPRHRVRITRPFFLGEAEVTQGEFLDVMGCNPSWSPTGEGAEKVLDRDTKRFPVERLTWDEAVEFCRRLGERPEEQSAGRKYRLPTEAEWEFASCYRRKPKKTRQNAVFLAV